MYTFFFVVHPRPTFGLPFLSSFCLLRHLNNKNKDCSNEVAVLLIVLWQSLQRWMPSSSYQTCICFALFGGGQKWLQLAAGNWSNCLPHATHRQTRAKIRANQSEPKTAAKRADRMLFSISSSRWGEGGGRRDVIMCPNFYCSLGIQCNGHTGRMGNVP